MNPRPIEIGDVHEMPSHPRPMRVIGLSDDVVLYDTWWPHENRWAMSKLIGTFSYYRMPRAIFVERSRRIRTDPLTESELDVHRPDLPFAFARSAELSWYGEGGSLSGDRSTLDASSIFLEPFGRRAGVKPMVQIHAENGRFFTAIELLRAAHAVQAPYRGDVRQTEGVGVYRLGIKKRIPSYYLWGAKSRHETAAAE